MLKQNGIKYFFYLLLMLSPVKTFVSSSVWWKAFQELEHFQLIIFLFQMIWYGITLFRTESPNYFIFQLFETICIRTIVL